MKRDAHLHDEKRSHSLRKWDVANWEWKSNE